jgi:hypothetical protein
VYDNPAKPGYAGALSPPRTQTQAKKGPCWCIRKTATFANLLLHTALRISDSAMLARERLQGDRIFL